MNRVVAFVAIGAFAVSVCMAIPASRGAEEPDANPFLVHKIESPYQAAKTTLRVLLPEDLQDGARYPVLYVLPVHEDGLFRHGDGLEEARKNDYHNRYGLICVAPSFTAKPWYADHDVDLQKHDESHMLETVLPFVESRFPARSDVEGRLLVGFSKSGWGALSLLLRHPHVFHRAAAWDVGIRVDTGPIDDAERAERIARDWGAAENFERYRISELIKTRGLDLGEAARLFYFNVEGTRGLGGSAIHQLLLERDVPHRYVYEPKRPHRWDSGWLPEAIAFLVEDLR